MTKLRFLVFSALALGLSACPPTYPKCESDDHCREKGEVCVQGQCQECATDKNCKPGFVCDANKCVPKPECTSDSACGTGKKCQAGKCVSKVQREPGTCDVSEDCPGDQDCQKGKCVTKGPMSCDFKPIRFEFNESKLTPDGQATLSQVVECIKGKKMKLNLEGHADERGTEEYNLQLSNRRAASVKRYLMDLGVNGNDLDTVGYGENRPAVPGSDEAAWAANRRVEIIKR